MIPDPASNKQFSVEEKNDDDDDSTNDNADDSKAAVEVTANQDNDLSKAQVTLPQYTLNKKNLKQFEPLYQYGNGNLPLKPPN